MKKVFTLMAFAMILTVSSTAYADQSEKENTHMKKNYMEKMDTDSDGVISKSEYLAKTGERFDKMDVNGDGFLSVDERQAKQEEMKEKRQKAKEKKAEKMKKEGKGKE